MIVPRRDGDLSRDQFNYLLTEDQRRACVMVELFKQAIENYCIVNKLRFNLSFKMGELEKLFVNFAERYELVGELYQYDEKGDCPAFSMVHDHRSDGSAGKLGSIAFHSSPKPLTFLNISRFRERVCEFTNIVLIEFLSNKKA